MMPHSRAANPEPAACATILEAIMQENEVAGTLDYCQPWTANHGPPRTLDYGNLGPPRTLDRRERWTGEMRVVRATVGGVQSPVRTGLAVAVNMQLSFQIAALHTAPASGRPRAARFPLNPYLMTVCPP